MVAYYEQVSMQMCYVAELLKVFLNLVGQLFH